MWQSRKEFGPLLEWPVILAILGSAAWVLGFVSLTWISLTGVIFPASPRGFGIDQAWLMYLGAVLGGLGSVVLLRLLPLAISRWIRGVRYSLLEFLIGSVIVSLALPAVCWQASSSSLPATPSLLISMFYFHFQEPAWWQEYGGYVDGAFSMLGIVMLNILALGALARWPSAPRSLRLPIMAGTIVLIILLAGPMFALLAAVTCTLLLLVLGLRTSPSGGARLTSCNKCSNKITDKPVPYKTEVRIRKRLVPNVKPR